MEQEDEQALIDALINGDEATFVSLFEQYHTSLVHVAMVYVDDRGIAEEIAQETWLSVLRGLVRFERRSSLKTWIFRILVNRAKTRGQREGRTIPFVEFSAYGAWLDEPAVLPERFQPDGHRLAGLWATAPRNWDNAVEEQLLQHEMETLIRGTIEALYSSQRIVITLRDLEGWSAQETCNVLEISESNQRVLLHRARSKVRRALEQYFDETNE